MLSSFQNAFGDREQQADRHYSYANRHNGIASSPFGVIANFIVMALLIGGGAYFVAQWAISISSFRQTSALSYRKSTTHCVTQIAHNFIINIIYEMNR